MTDAKSAVTAETETEIPISIYHECYRCGNVLHNVVKGVRRGKSLNLLLRCSVCGGVSEYTTKQRAHITLPVVVSWMSESKRCTIRLLENETVSIGDELIADGARAIVTGIESHGKRIGTAKVGEISSLWMKKFEYVLIKVSIHAGIGRVRSDLFFARPEDEIAVGDEIEIGGSIYKIFSIRTGSRTLKRGCVRARHVIRIYVRKPRFHSNVKRTPRPYRSKPTLR